MMEIIDNIAVGIGIGAGWLLFLGLVLFLLVNKKYLTVARLVAKSGANSINEFIELGAENLKKLVNIGADGIIDLIKLAEKANVKDLLEVIENQEHIDKNEKFGLHATPEVQARMNAALKDSVKKNQK